MKKLKIQEVSLKYKRNRPDRDIQVITANDAYDVLKSVWDENRIDLLEEFKIILLDVKNCVLGVSSISTGGISTCIVDPKIVFATALKANSSSIILAHNHPSGVLDASEADIKTTRQLVEGGKMLSMPVYDHLILTSSGFFSMAENLLIPR
ncbi:RadC-like JAB domain-containing protein [Pedobacter suwonensis]|uniref:RadC-like JAB domain-containing protein n=1 Tax=Pedobacter suwonensis TaxID=332999 RepID=A0A1I0TSV0_9SPHI|nr:JAB domain-containing protein [Pedobacter suwonensis]SFA54848.1 RadC-like JAB domain-containing protein [Pedobacter suwonensis]